MIHRPIVNELQYAAVQIRLPSRLITPLHIRPGDCLYSVILKPDLSKSENAGLRGGLNPFATVYASPLPFKAWGRLIKARFTTGPGPGTTLSLCKRLSDADLYARSFQTSEHHSLAAPSGEIQGAVVVPDTEVVLEVPAKQFLNNQNSQGVDGIYSVAEENIQLHHLLNAILREDPREDTKQFQQSVTSCINALNSRLQRPGDKQQFKISVDSLGPLSALNALSRHSAWTKQVLERCDDNKKDAWLPCEQWQRTLWPESRASAEGIGGSSIVLLGSVNVDEKLLTLHFFNLHDQLLMAFDLVVPSAGLEHRWWQWIYDEIARCKGSVLSSHSTARFEGRWATLSIVAAYPAKRLDENIEAWTTVQADDIGLVLTSFRNLQGYAARLRSEPERSQDAFQSLADDIGTEALGSPRDSTIRVTKPGKGWLRARVAHHCLGVENAKGQLIQRPRLDSTLKNGRMWYQEPVEASSKYAFRFGRNPFNFTRPLSLKDYSVLYGSFDEMRRVDSRARLADRLATHIRSAHSENIVLVGAHRSGKTTIMNIVVDLINDGKEDEDSAVIAVKINTAVTPPEQLFLAVYQEILNLEKKPWRFNSPKAKAVRFVKSAGTAIANSFHNVFKSNASLELDVTLPFLSSLRIATADAINVEAEHRRELEQRRGQEAMPEMELTARRAARLRASVALLKKLLRDASDEGERFKVVIALDEVADASAWGTNWAFPAWRQLIEDPGLPEARWLFSSTRPLAVSTGYSPLGNAMREYNMEPLRDVEAEVFLNAFDSFDSKWWDAADVSKMARVKPVVTFHARKRIMWLAGNQPYLMQLMCCHLFDECIRTSVPILTGRLVRKIVKGRILSELSDFFLGQWKTLDSEHATAILNAVAETASSMDLWRHRPDDRRIRFKCNPEVQKSLERAGLGSQRLPMVFVPLFVMWIREHFATAGTTKV
jgi:hypothetical protein